MTACVGVLLAHLNGLASTFTRTSLPIVPVRTPVGTDYPRIGCNYAQPEGRHRHVVVIGHPQGWHRGKIGPKSPRAGLLVAPHRAGWIALVTRCS